MRTERSAGAVRIHVCDNGPGVPEDVRERIAEPFFTTKITGEGLGLGLSISRALIHEFGGSLVFETAEGEGATFTVSLPEAVSLREAAE
ncbi:ATP-binding protein [Shinella sp. S4-D37]|uniref:sensor histidine kinase n=1 Tax=Shinella sp. S4-D37 TaxID=3161999 RepID=UPI0034659409